MRNYESAAKHLESAVELTRRGKFNAAFREYRKAIQLRHGYSEAHAVYASALVDRGRYPDAVEQFRRVLEIDPSYEIDVFQLSTALDHSDDIQQTVDVRRFQEIADLHDNPDLYHQWGQVLELMARHDKAIEQFRNALTKNPELQLDIERLCQALDGSATTELQVKSFQAEIERLQNAYAFNSWGKVLLTLGKHDAAIDLFNNAIAAQDPWAEPYVNRGEALFKLGDYQGAVAVFREAVKRDDRLPRAYSWLGRALIQLEEYTDAVATYRQASEKAPSADYLEPWREAIRHLPEPRLEIDEYQTVLAMYAPSLGGQDEWLEFLIGEGRASEAALQLALVEARNLDPSARFELQEILAELPDKRDTLARIQVVFDEADEPAGYVRWATTLARINHYDAALEQLSRAFESLSSPRNDRLWFGLFFYVADFISNELPSEERHAALVRIEHALKQLSDPVLWMQWGDALADLLHLEREAVPCYRAALVLNPSNSSLIEHTTDFLRRSSDQWSALQQFQETAEASSRADVACAWGRILDALGKEKAALEQFQRAVRLKRDFADAYYFLGQVYSRQGRYGEACSQFQKAVQHAQGHIDAIFDWGTALLKSGQQEEGIQRYLRAINLQFDGAPQILERLQQPTQNLLSWDNTVVSRFQATVDEIHSAAVLTRWGVLLTRVGRHEAAIEQHRRAVHLDPDHGDSYVNWRNAIGRAGITPERIDEYDQAIEQYIGNADSYHEWGNFLGMLKRFEEAAEKYRKALEKDPRHSGAHSAWIELLLQVNDVKMARIQAQRLLAYDPRNANAYSQLAWAAYLDGAYDVAQQQYELALEITESAFLLQMYAWVLYKAGRGDLAARKYEEAIQKWPHYSDCYFAYGNFLLETRRYSEAATRYEEAIAQDPTHVSARHNLAAILHHQGQYEEAWGKWRDAIQAYERLEPPLVRAVDKGAFVNVDELHFYAMVVHGIKYDRERAIAILEQGLDFDPNNTRVLGGLAGLYWEMKEDTLGGGTEVARQQSNYHWLAMDYFHRAERLLKERLARYHNYFYLTELGDLYLTVEEYGRAQGCFDEARATGKNEPIPYVNLGVIHLRQKESDMAIPLFQEALRLDPYDLDVQSSLAEAYLRTDKLDEAEMAYRHVLNIAPNHVQSLIGLGEVCTALGEKNDTDRYSEAIERYSRALEVADNERVRSKYLKRQERAAVYYSRGYARVQLFESPGVQRDVRLLRQALHDFKKCGEELNPAHEKAKRAIEKIEDRLRYFYPQRLTETIGPLTMFGLSMIVFLTVQLLFFVIPIIDRPLLTITESSLREIRNQLPVGLSQQVEPLVGQSFPNEQAVSIALQRLVESTRMDTVRTVVLQNIGRVSAFGSLPEIGIGSYAALTFGSLLFMVVGLYLPQVLKLKVAGIELEKSSVDQAQAIGRGTLGIGR